MHGHNHRLHEQAEDLAQLAIATLNRQRLDAVFVLGDVTEDGTPEQMECAAPVLSAIAHPWYVVPGDGDRGAVRSGAFDRLLSEHVAPPYWRLNNRIGVVSLREDANAVSGAFRFDHARCAQSVAALRADAPRTLLVLSHFPLICQRNWAALHNGQHAVCPPNGRQVLRDLAACIQQRVVILCGHQHWHHMSDGADWIQCTTGAMIEFPMEVRVITIADDTFYVNTLAAGAESQRQASFHRARWVAGWTPDRVLKAVL